jgi:CelD/BcsL family acetyltransferase involved in cellulose biosynthesis
MLMACESASLTGVASVDVINDVSAFAGLREEWTHLLASSTSDCIFLTWEWLYTWWRHLAEGRRLSILTVREAGELIAIAPFAVAPRYRFGHALETLEFLGSGQVGSDYLDIIASQGCEELAVRALRTYLADRKYAIRLSNVKPESLAAELARQLGRDHWPLIEVPANICPYIPLAGLTWESYLASLGSEHRYGFRRKTQRLSRDYTVAWLQPANLAESREAIDAAIALHKLRWNGHGQSDAFHTPSLIAFHREFAPLAFERGWLRLYLLMLNDHPAASLYGFLYRSKFYFYQSGFDPAYTKQSIGLVAMGLSIRDAIAEHATEYDLLHGNEPYKAHWAQASCNIERFELFPANTLGRLSKTSVEMVRKTRKLALGVLNIGQ